MWRGKKHKLFLFKCNYTDRSLLARLLFDIVNALHGLLLFLVLVVFRARIKRELAGKKLCCCLHAPEHWRNKVDIEHQRLNENDEEGTMAFNSTTEGGN